MSAPAVRARHLLQKLLLATEGGVLDAAEAVRGCALFGISANTTRVALTRLQAAGLIEAVGRGAYRLGPAGRALGEEVGRWRTTEARLRPWDGGWIAVVTGVAGRTDRVALRARERALAVVGLRPLDDGLFVRPDNFTGGVGFARERLRILGLEASIPVFLASGLDEDLERRARGLWDVGALEATYRDGRRRLEESMARFDRLPAEDAAREAYLLGDEAIRAIVFDPMLPEPLVAADERRAFVEVTRRYDDAGRRAWRRFLAG